MSKLKNIALGSLLLLAFNVFSQTTYVWTGAGGSFQVAANWTPARTTPATTDILSIAGAGITISNVPTQTIGRLIVAGTGTKIFTPSNAASTVTLTIQGGISPNLFLESGDIFFSTILGTSFNIIASNVSVPGARTLTLNSNNVSFTSTGVFLNNGTITNNGAIIFSPTSIYNHAQNGGNVPLATWQTGSTCSITGSVGLSANQMNQTFWNVVYNMPSAGPGRRILSVNNDIMRVSGTLSIINTGAPANIFNLTGSTSSINTTLTVNNFIIQNGDVRLTEDNTETILFNVLGNITQTGGTFTSSNPNASMVIGGASSTISLISPLTGIPVILNKSTTNSGLNLLSNVSLNNLSIISGMVITNANTISITGNSIGASSSTGWVIGNLVENFVTGANVNRTFEVGTASNYTPVSITFPSVTTGGSLLVNSNAGDAAAIGSSELNAVESINNNWLITVASGFSSPSPLNYNSTFNYTAATKDAGVDDAKLVLGLFNGSAWSYLAQTSVTSVSATFNAINSLNNFQIAEPQATTELFSYQNGNWNNPNTWTEDPSGTTLINPRIPSLFNKVTILNGKTVSLSATVNTNGINLVLNLGSTFDLKTFTINTLSGLSGQGILKLNSTNLPVVNAATTFFNAGQGTIEFYNLTTLLPISTTNYNNLWLTKDNNIATNYIYTLGSNLNLNGELRIRNLQNIGTSTLSVGNSTVARNITVSGNLIVGDVAGGATNAVLSISSGFTAQHTANLFGDLLNYGTVDLSNGTQYAASAATQSMLLSFRGSTNNQLFCDGPTEIFSMTVDKGTDQTYVLSLSATASNYFKFMILGNGLPISMGTLKLGNNIVLDRLVDTGNYDIGGTTNSGCQLWIDGAIVRNTSMQIGGGALIPFGKFRITNGAITISGAGIVPRYNGEIFIEGGYINAAKIRTSILAGVIPRGTFFMSGGVLDLNRSDLTGKENFNNAPNAGGLHSPFTFPFADASYIVSGGIMNVYSIGFADNKANALFMLNSSPQNINVTGGTVNFSIAGTNNFQNNISSTAPFYDLNIYETSTLTGSRFIALTDQYLDSPYTSTGFDLFIPKRNLIVKNKLYIDGVNSPVLSLSGAELYINRDLEIASGGIVVPTASNVYFNGTGSQIVLLNGSVSGIIGNLNFSNTGPTPISLQGSLATISTIGLNINSGVVNDGGKTIKVTGNILNNGFHRGNGKLELVGTSTQYFNGNGTGIFGNVDLNNTDPGTDGAVLNTNITIRNSLRLVSNEIFNLGTYNLKLDSNVTQNCIITTVGPGFSATKFLKTAGNQSDGGLTLFALNNASTLFYPIGTGSFYTPVTATLSGISGAVNQGYIQITVNNAALATLSVTGVVNSALLYYWRARASNFVSLPTISYSFNSSVAGIWPTGIIGTPNNFVGGRVVIPNRFPETTTVTSNGLISIASHTIPTDALYTAAQSNRFAGGLRIFYNTYNVSGGYNINDDNRWSLSCHTCTTTNLDPGPTDVLSLTGFGNGTTSQGWVYINVNTTVAGVIFGAATGDGWQPRLSVYEGNSANLGYVSGNFGTIYSNYNGANPPFITGDFGSFAKNFSNQFNYNNSGSTTITLPSNIIQYPNLRLEAYGSSNKIILPNVDIQINNDFIIGDNAKVYTNSSSGSTVYVENQLQLGQTAGLEGSFNYSNSSFATKLNVRKVWITNSSAMNGIFMETPTTSSQINHKLILREYIYQALGSINLFSSNAGNTNASVLELQSTIAGFYSRDGGTVPNLYQIIVNKGTTQTPLFDFWNSANLLGPANQSIKPITFQNGTLSLKNSGINFNLSSGGGTVSIPSTAGLQVENGSTINMSSTTGILLDGLLRFRNGGIGNFNDGINNTYIEYSSSDNARLEVLGNSSLNVGSQIRKGLFTNAGSLKYVQTGGNVTVAGLGANSNNPKFEIDNTGSSISMSGGNFYIQRGGGGTSFGDLYLDPGITNITGGTFIFSPLSTIGNQSYRIISSPILNNVQIVSGGTSSAMGIIKVYPLRVNNDLLVSTNATLDANSFGVELKGNTTFSGTYLPTSNTTSFTGVGLQNLVLNNSVAFNNFLMDKSNVLSLSGLNTTINGLLSLSNGILDDGGLSVVANGNVFNSALHIGVGKIILSGTGTKFVQGNGLGRFTNIDVTASSEPFFKDEMTINGNLNFVNNGIYIAGFALNLGLNASVAGVSSIKFIRTNGVSADDGVVKQLPATTFDYTFPVGYFGKYTPARYVATSNSALGSIRIIPVNEAHPLTTDPLNLQLNYYWVATSSGFSGLAVNHSYTYVDSDVRGTENLYKAGRSIQGDWAPYYGGFAASIGGVNTTTNVISINGLSFINGEYTAGEASELQVVLTYYSRNATLGGNWDNVNTWSTDPILKHAGSVTGFTPFGQPIVIRAGHAVLTNGNMREAYSTSVSGILDIATTFGHNLGIVLGTGIIRIAANPSLLFVLPAGQLTSFVSSATGGTFEFYGSNNGDLPPMNPPDLIRFNNVLLSGSGAKRINSPSPIYNIGGNLSITGGSLENVANNNITVSKNWINTVGISAFNPGTNSTKYVEFNGSNQQITGQNQFRGLIISGGGTKTFNSNNDIIGQLQLINGLVDVGSNILSISTSDGSVSGGSSFSFVKGLLQKRFLTGSSVNQNYEVGDGSYSPVSVTFPSVSTQGNLAVRANAGAHPLANLSCISNTKRVNRYWTITATSPIVTTSYDVSATFIPADVIGGANTSLFIPSLLTGGVWSLPGVGTRTATSTQATSVTYYGDMIVGEPKSSVGVTIVGPAMPVCAGTVLNFTALGVNGGTSPGYNWLKDVSGTTTTGLATTQIFTTSTLGNGDIVKARFISSDGGCTIGNPAFSNGIPVSFGASGQWIGATSNVWTVPGNWCGGIAPTGSSDAIINVSPIYPLLNSTTDIRNLNLGAGASMTVNTNFRIAGDFVNNGNFIVTSGNQILLNGVGNQNISGSSPITTPFLQILGGGTKNLSSAVNVTGLITMSSSTATLASNGNLVLISNAAGTAGVSAMTATAAISGNVRVQNYMGSKINRRYLAFPVSGAPISQLQNSIFVNGVGVGFDSPTYIPSVLTYDETQIGQVNIGKTRATSTGQILQRGVGYEILVRPRTVAPTETRANQPTTPVTLEVVGLLNQGNLGIPITFTNTGNATADGYNFVGNPYPSNIDWLSPAWTKTNISPNIYFLDPGSTLTSASTVVGIAYTYVPGVGCIPALAGCNSLIAQGQGFYVLATAAGAALNVTEAVKSSGVARRNFRTEEETLNNLIRVTAIAPNGIRDETVIRIGDIYNDNYENVTADVLKFANSGMNLSTQSKEGYNMVLNSIPLLDSLKVVPLIFSSNLSGSYTMIVSESVSLLADAPIVYIRSNSDSTLTEVKNFEKLSFGYVSSVTSAPKYSLVIKKSAKLTAETEVEAEVEKEEVTAVKELFSKNNVSVYPNPFKETITLTFSKVIEGDFIVEVINMMGNGVLTKNYSNLDIKNGKLTIEKMDMPASTYILKVKNVNGIIAIIKVGKI